MSGLAEFMLSAGKTVAGSDLAENIYTHKLRLLGAKIETSDGCGSVADFDAVVYTDAIQKNDARLIEAEKLGKTIISRGQLLYEISRTFERVIAVSGCHGKTTCTSMLAHIFYAAGAPFCMHAGGRDVDFGNFRYSGNKFFITEACEYKKNFLLLKPDIAVVLNNDPDHMECYGSVEKLNEAYETFIKSSDISVARAGDFKIGTITFSLGGAGNYRAENLRSLKGKYSFNVYENDARLGKIELKVYGKHNVYNALAATAAARSACIGFDAIVRGLKAFKGVERRFENIGDINGVKCIADYAHHPREIEASIKTAKRITKGKLFVIFQPHTYSRTKNFFAEFVKVLSKVDNILIYKTFAAREYFDDKGSALTLSQAVKNAKYGDCPHDIVDFINIAHNEDTVLILGAGDIYDIAKALILSKIE